MMETVTLIEFVRDVWGEFPQRHRNSSRSHLPLELSGGDVIALQFQFSGKNFNG
jgi:hypothetical protein